MWRAHLVALTLAWAALEQQQSTANTIDLATLALYRKLGGIYTMLAVESGWIVNVKKGLPGFTFDGNPKGKLPDVKISFGLNMAHANALTDDGLKHLAHLKYLTMLSLRA